MAFRIKGRSGLILLAVAAALCAVAIGFLVLQVRSDLDRLNTAASDNAQWTLSQAEVEFLELKVAADEVADGNAAAVADLRLEFDIFYSRVATLSNSSLYAALRDSAEYDAALAKIRGFLDESLALIDQPDTALVARAPELEARIDALRPSVRALATSGLAHFATLSDERRTTFADTLTRLAAVTSLLILALGLAATYSHSQSRETRRRGRELSSAYARLNTVLGTSLDGVVVTDTEGRILDFNDAAEQIFKRRAQDVVGASIGEVIVPPHLRAAHEAGMKRMKETGVTRVVGHGRVQLEGMRSDGEVFPVELALQTAEADGAQLVVAFLRDISTRVAAEQELVNARDRALAGEKAKSDFLAIMTHEIRTPLNGIVGNISLIDDTELTEQQAEYVRNMKISGEILMQHVDTVMDITRFETGKMQFSDRAVHLGRLVQDTVDSQTSNAERNNNRLDWRWVGDGIDWISVDPMRLQQILLNLVGNAIKFTRDGRISIELERIDPEPDAKRETVEFRIIDEGIGIAEADLDHVFEDFHTADPSFDRTVEGTGLGLGIAKRFAEGLGGEIGAESEPGVGSVFWLRLPVARAEPPRDADTPDDGVLSTGPLRVLVVEDNEINRHVVREMLHSFGHDVAEVDNGQSAVDLAHSERFDLIFMDISMPVMDGLEATRRIRADGGASSAVPIIALSANVLPDAQARFVAAGMTDFLGKPFTKPELWELLARHNAGTTAAPAAVSDAGNAHVPDEIHSRYFEVFRRETHDLVEWLDSGPTDLQEIAFRSHKIAGGAAAFEAHDLRQSLLDLERAALSGDPTEVRRKTEAALPHLARLAGQRLPI